MMKLVCAVIALGMMAAACNNSADAQDGASAVKEMQGELFGDSITADGAISYAQLLSQMADKDSMAVKVVGEVAGVCQKKGCWMNIVSGQPDDEALFVQFKDYGFFMPKDIQGRKVVLEGYAYKAITPVDELRHYAEDDGKSKEEIETITEPLEELKFMASGVILLPAEGTK